MKIFLHTLIIFLAFTFNSFAQVNVTFRVNMQQQTVSPNGVHLAGNFYDINGDLNPENPGLVNWNPDSIPLLDLNADNIYEVTLQLIPATYQFKFINGNVWGTDESIPSTCAVGGNREVTINPIDTILPAYCFQSCAVCSTAPADSVNVTFKVDMYYQTVSDSGVHLSGDFNIWNTSSIPMINTGGSSYEVMLTLPKDSVYQYKFLNGNSINDYETLSSNFCTDMSGQNRQLYLGSTDTTLLNVCYGSCYTCSIITPINITFKVDMSQVANISPLGVHLAGSFQNWDPALTPMVNMGAGIYEVVISMNPNQVIEYKFINGNAWGSDESVPLACANSAGNREITIYNFDFTLGVVCYAQCGVCVPPVTSDSIDVTFNVDLQGQSISPNGVHLAGSFQGWDPATTLMTNTSASIYTVTLSLPESTYFEYKFVNGNAWGTDETISGSCTANQNRFITTLTSNENVPLVCFGSCAICAPGNVVNVTFQVDMGSVPVSPNGIHIIGDFQGWNAAATSMVNLIGGLYQYTVALAGGTTVQYKYVNGNDIASEENVPLTCAYSSTINNRFFVVPNSNTLMPKVCFANCVACVVGVEEANSNETVKIYPSVTTGNIYIDNYFSKNLTIRIFDATGKFMRAENIINTTSKIDLSSLPEGVYHLQLMNDKFFMNQKIVLMR